MPCFYFSSVLETKAFTLSVNVRAYRFGVQVLAVSAAVYILAIGHIYIVYCNEDEERCKPKADQYKAGFKTSVTLLTP